MIMSSAIRVHRKVLALCTLYVLWILALVTYLFPLLFRLSNALRHIAGSKHTQRHLDD